MTLDQLKTFVTIAKEGGLRAASKILYKTQPTLSTGMKNLEKELGVTLLNRDSYRVKLTEEGEALFEKAEDILAHLDQFKTLAEELSMGWEPRLNLAIDYLCPLSYLQKVLRRFMKTCLKTKIELDFVVLSGAEDKLLNQEANLAITPFVSEYSKVEYQKTCEVKIVPVASNKAVKTPEPDLNSFLKLPQIIAKDSSGQTHGIDFGLHASSDKWIVSDHMVKKELILNGFGWGHLEQTSIEKELNYGSLLELNIQDVSSKKLPLYIVRSLEKPFGPAAQDMWDYILESFH